MQVRCKYDVRTVRLKTQQSVSVLAHILHGGARIDDSYMRSVPRGGGMIGNMTMTDVDQIPSALCIVERRKAWPNALGDWSLT